MDKKPLFLIVLNGAFLFAADLIKQLNIDCEVSFVKVASYAGTQSQGAVKTLIGLNEEIGGRNIVIIEDIVDTGLTLHNLLNQLQEMGPQTITCCSLLVKPEALKHPVVINYRGFEIGNDFVVGYGLDYDGLGRNHTGIYKLKE